MSEVKKKVAKLDQDKMEDVKGGIPYEEPGIIPLDEPIVVVTPGTGEDPTATTVVEPRGCFDGYHDADSCLPGHGAVNACGDGYSVVYN